MPLFACTGAVISKSQWMEELSKQMESLTSESKCIDSTVVILNYVLK